MRYTECPIPTLPVRYQDTERFHVGSFGQMDGSHVQMVYDAQDPDRLEISPSPAPPNPTYHDFNYKPMPLDKVAETLNQCMDGVSVIGISSKRTVFGYEVWTLTVAVGAGQYEFHFRTSVPPEETVPHRVGTLQSVAGHAARIIGDMVSRKIRDELEYKLRGYM